MKNIEKIQTMSVDELTDYIAAVYFTGKFMEHYKDKKTINDDFDLTLTDYKSWLLMEEE